MITWRARAHQQCDFVLLLAYQTNRVIPEHAGALVTIMDQREKQSDGITW